MADESGLTAVVRRAAQANAKLYKGWMELTLEYMRGMSEIFGGVASTMRSPAQPTAEMDSGASTLVLEGEAGTSAIGSFLVSNDLDRPLSCKLVSSDYGDPTGATVKARTIFDPASLELAAGEQKVVKVMVTIDEALIPGVGYAGEIAIAGMDGFAVPVVIRRQHSLDEASRVFDDFEPIKTTSPTRDATSRAEKAAAPSASKGASAKSKKGTTKASAKAGARGNAKTSAVATAKKGTRGG
jgi:hypothetical protein